MCHMSSTSSLILSTVIVSTTKQWDIEDITQVIIRVYTIIPYIGYISTDKNSRVSKYSTIKNFGYVATCNTTVYSLIMFRAF